MSDKEKDDNSDIDGNKAETETDDQYNTEINNPIKYLEDLINKYSHLTTASQCLIQI